MLIESKNGFCKDIFYRHFQYSLDTVYLQKNISFDFDEIPWNVLFWYSRILYFSSFMQSTFVVHCQIASDSDSAATVASRIYGRYPMIIHWIILRQVELNGFLFYIYVHLFYSILMFFLLNLFVDDLSNGMNNRVCYTIFSSTIVIEIECMRQTCD